MGNSSSESDNIPSLIKAWLGLYHAVPKIYLPNTNIDISFTFACGAVLTCVKLLFQFLLETYFGWPTNSDLTWDAAASMTGVFHSMNLLPPIWMLLVAQSKYAPSAPLHTSPTWWQDASQALIQLTTGYMVYDLILNIIVLRWKEGLHATDYLYVGHHVATTVYMTSTRVYRAGHVSAMVCMWLGEVTNPLFNTYLITNLAKTASVPFPLVSQIELACALLFVLIRAIVSPLIFVHMTYNLLFSKDAKANIPIGLRILWVAMIWGVVIGSVPWVNDFGQVIKSYVGISGPKEEL